MSIPLGHAHLQDQEILTDGADEQESLHAHTPVHGSRLRPSEPSPRAGRSVVLIVDDNKDMRRYIASLLEDSYDIRLARDAKHAVEQISVAKPDLIITDLMMPKHDGFELVTSLKTNHDLSAIPVIMLTAKASRADRLLGLANDVDVYLTKPFDAQELISHVRNLIRRYARYIEREKKETKAVIKTDQGADSFVGRATEIVDQNLTDPSFGVSDLAAKLHVSRATLHRRLVEKTQQSSSEFIRNIRLQKAQELVQLGRVASIKQLAVAVGFNQAAYFSRLYRKTFGTQPL